MKINISFVQNICQLYKIKIFLIDAGLYYIDSLMGSTVLFGARVRQSRMHVSMAAVASRRVRSPSVGRPVDGGGLCVHVLHTEEGRALPVLF